jgi:hypothetical protein
MANEVIFDPTLMDSLDEDTTPLPAEFDADADYNAPPPPLPDGWHMAKLKLAGVKDGDGRQVPFSKRPWGAIPSTFHTSLTAHMIDPGGAQDGKIATDNTVTTHVDPKRHNTSKAVAYQKAINEGSFRGTSEGQIMKALLEDLQSEPTVWVRTQLEGQAPEASRAFTEAKKAGSLAPGTKAPKTFRGEKAFTQEGKLTGRAFDADAKEFVVGRPVIVDVKPQSFTPPNM